MFRCRKVVQEKRLHIAIYVSDGIGRLHEIIFRVLGKEVLQFTAYNGAGCLSVVVCVNALHQSGRGSK